MLGLLQGSSGGLSHNDSTTDEAKTIHIPVIEMTNKLIAEYLPVKILVEDLSKPGENGLVEALFGLDLTRPCLPLEFYFLLILWYHSWP